MDITKEFLLSQIQHFEGQRNNAHDMAVASQAAIDVCRALLNRLESEPESEKPDGNAI